MSEYDIDVYMCFLSESLGCDSVYLKRPVNKDIHRSVLCCQALHYSYPVQPGVNYKSPSEMYQYMIQWMNIIF